MARILLLLLVSATIAAQQAQAQAPTQPASEPGAGVKVSFRPSVAIVVGIFTMIFSLTFLLLMYAKYCHPANTPLLPATTTASPSRAPLETEAESAGVGKAVIESLPFFRFAALRGARQGLECAVCLARFDDADLLRLLPRCRHAFHLDCVDRWLASSASCPLCRARVHPDDADLGLKYAAASARFVFGLAGDDAAVGAAAAPASGRDLLTGIFVERVPSSRFGDDDAAAAATDDSGNKLDRHRHRIVVSDSVFKSRWSDLNSADLIALDTEMLRSVSSGRFPYPYPDDDIIFLGDDEHEVRGHHEDGAGMSIEIENKRLLDVEGSGGKAKAKAAPRLGGCGGSEAMAVEPSARLSLGSSSAARLVSSGVRSMSEIVRLPRVAVRETTEEEERARRRWVPIARRTARWFAARSREEDVNAADRLRV